MTATQTSSTRSGILARVLRALPALTLLAVLTITASAEYALARTVLDLPPQIAWALPAAIDSYVLAALHTRRDVPAAITVMAGALLASMGAHLAQVGRAEHLPVTWTAPLATAIMTVLVVVAWRVHVLIDAPATDTAGALDPDRVGVTVTTEQQPALPAVASTPAPSTALADTHPVAPQALPHPPTPSAASAPQPDQPEASPRPARPDTPREAERTQPGAASVSTTAPAPSRTTTTSSASVTDEQILATITGQPPSIRALMRAHGIGQSRASRLHRIAQQNHANQRATSTQENHQESPEQHSQNRIEEDRRQGREDQAEIENQEIRTKTIDESHPCITDRVGQSERLEEWADRALWAEFAESGDA